jgi:adenylosuccinate synthase
MYNRALEESRDRHGSCGLGFGATIERHETFPKLFAQDLIFPKILAEKLKAVARYYEDKIKAGGSDKLAAFYYDHDFEKATLQFLKAARNCCPLVQLIGERDFFALQKNKSATCIFEGAQGILLDMDLGFFPYVTRSYTTSRNAMAIMKRNCLPRPSVYYVTRSYQTRHGAGPMTNEHLSLEIDINEQETNFFNPWQGSFRKAVLDLDLLRYAVLGDSHFSGDVPKSLVITCLDQIKGDIPVTIGGELKNFSPAGLAKELLPDYHELLLSASDISDSINKERTGFSGIIR